MNMDIWQLKDIGLLLLAAGTVYGAIRADIKNIHERIKRLEDKLFD